ncbi:GntR family transcriptional regulator [Desulfuribacillus stibiiarsenatis]|uniref:GntR family transcriptional regulator n=1 Tax=Desulfuribacillus stibiiarsenatis TaxID=1390249 RepID=A0A1E5L4P2_9FIRM|nr:GntR family transcriptional regulator [Desulfuribacillus stibiiarsenatis]OEH85080.1 GntR family transcriptional regulator [Desulfuribacillus stibiiarsenatis]
MFLKTESAEPIYVQLAKWLEGEILSGNIKDNEKMYSQYQLADMFNINPATAAKGINILADEGILYKKRGLGMFVTMDAKDQILKKRKSQTLQQLIVELVVEARRLGVTEDELLGMIKSVNSRGTS